MNKLKKEIKGFTIIEVVIVLAIAALIIVIVLLAVSALQRSQRTKAAQDYASRVLSAMESYASDQIGAGQTLNGFSTLPSTAGLNPPSYITNTHAGTSAAADISEVVYAFGTTCKADGSLQGGGDSNNQFSVSYFNQSTNHAACIQNK